VSLRFGGSVVLLACLFVPLSTCTYQGKTTTNIPIDHPSTSLFLTYCTPLLLAGVSMWVRRRNVRLAALLAAIVAALAGGYSIWIATLFAEPAYGFYVAQAALALTLCTAIPELIHELRARRHPIRELDYET
jgi:heme exporter protein D